MDRRAAAAAAAAEEGDENTRRRRSPPGSPRGEALAPRATAAAVMVPVGGSVEGGRAGGRPPRRPTSPRVAPIAVPVPRSSADARQVEASAVSALTNDDESSPLFPSHEDTASADDRRGASRLRMAMEDEAARSLTGRGEQEERRGVSFGYEFSESDTSRPVSPPSLVPIVGTEAASPEQTAASAALIRPRRASPGAATAGGIGDNLPPSPAAAIFPPDRANDSMMPPALAYSPMIPVGRGGGVAAAEPLLRLPGAASGTTQSFDSPAAIDTGAGAGEATTNMGHERQATRITLADVTAASPFEDEAESAILQALEAKEWEGGFEDDNAKYNKVMARNAEHRRRKTAESMFSNVPNEALQMFAEEEERSQATTTRRPGPAPVPASPGGIETKPSTDSHDSERTPTCPGLFRRRTTKILRPPRIDTEGSAAAVATLAESGGETPKPTLKEVATRLKRMQMVSKAVMGGGSNGGAAGTTGEAAGTERTAEGGPVPVAKTEFLKAAKKAESRRTLAATYATEPGSQAPPIPTLPAKKEREPLIQPIEKIITGAPGAKPVSGADKLTNDAAILLGDNDDEMYEEGSFADLEAQRRPKLTERNLSKLRGAVRAVGMLAALKRDVTEEDRTAKQAGVPSEVKADAQQEEDDNEEDYFSEKEHHDEGNIGEMDTFRNREMFLYRTKHKAWASILSEVLKPSLPKIKLFGFTAVFFIILPMLLVASVLFYAVDNPIAGCAELRDKSNCASYSWWIIFLGIRQVITLGLAKATEVVVVEIIALRTKVFVRVLGPYITLLTVQARGWPFIIFFWAVWDFIMLYGNYDFPKHWLYWQVNITMMNSENPAGVITYSDSYMRTLIAVIVFGFCVGLKRGVLALYLGKNSVQHYGKQVEKLMRKMLLISDVAHLAVEIKNEHYQYLSPDLDLKAIRGIKLGDEDDDDNSESDRTSKPSAATSFRGANKAKNLQQRPNTEISGVTMATATTDRNEAAVLSRPGLERQPRAMMHLSSTTKVKLEELIGEWEEPEIMAGSRFANDISIQEVLQFRQAVAALDYKYPFSVAFGSARTREACIESAQAVFENLLLHTPQSGDLLPFGTIALVALQSTGEIDEQKAKRLLRLFRPDRNGNLTALDFVKSTDKVYKSLRTLRAAIANASQIDNAFERLVNFFFYFFLFMVALAILNLNPWALVVSLSGFLLGFTFLFGSAASQYFEGLLLILVRRPYDIGDRVAISNPQNDTSPNGSSCWFVEEITLYATTVRFGTTNEVATYSNGSLASMRIINANRSPKATVYIYLKFASDISYERVMVFKSVIERFVKDRPRQWLSMSAFRSTRVEADLGFIEYVLVLVHVEKWQNVGPILTSKAEASSYCLEVQKKLDMRYSAPPLPVNLAVLQNEKEVFPFEAHRVGEEDARAASTSTSDFGTLGHLFEKPTEAKKTR